LTIQILMTLCLTFSPGLAAAADGLDGIDVYGTAQLGEGDLLRDYGPQLKRYVRLQKQKSKGAVRSSDVLKLELESAVRRKGPFAYVRMQRVPSVQGGGSVIVFDFVEKKDAAARMPFRPAPTGRLGDPAGLVAAWRQYSEMGAELSRKGLLATDRVECPAFYCTWGDATPDLKILQDRFVQEVPSNKQSLLRVFKEDRDPQRRADALNLLAYLRSGPEVSETAELGMTDPDDRVREAAMRMFSDMAVYRKDAPLPAEKIARVLDYPSVDDRTRALAVMLGLAGHPVYRKFALQSASTQVLKLLRMRNSSNHDMALTVLRMLSQKDLGGTDFQGWEEAIREARKAESQASDKKK